MQDRRRDHEDGLLMPILLACIASIAIGLWLYSFIPDPTPASVEEIKHLMLFPEAVIPKPKEKYTYFCLLFLTPFIIFFSTRTLKDSARLSSRVDIIALICGYSIFMALIARDEFWSHLIQMTNIKYLDLAIFVSFAAALIWPIVSPIDQKIEATSKWLLALIVSLGASLEFFSRVFGAQSVSYTGDFYSHYDAVVYSLSQILNGGSCLVDVVPQYGCYGEVIRPFVDVIGGVTLSTTIVLAAIQCLSFLLLCLFVGRSIQSRWLTLLGVLIFIPITNRIWYGASDQYFQGLPIRLIMPVASLFVAEMWIRCESVKRACLLGLFSGFSVVWNLDTGAVIFVALLAILIFSGCTTSDWKLYNILKRRKHLACYLVGAAVSFALFTVEVWLRSAQWPNFMKYIVFQQIFFGSGAFMLPIKPVISLWSAFIAIAGISLILVISKIGKGPRDSRSELNAYISLLALGIFSYHLGRSISDTLALVAWPFVILILYLADLAWVYRLRFFGWSALIGRAALAIPLSTMALVVWTGIPTAWIVTKQHYLQWQSATAPEDSFSDTEYLKQNVRPGSRVAIMSKDQSVFFSETHSKSAISGPGLAETLTKADAQNQLFQLLHPDFTDLFIGADICCATFTSEYPHLIAENIALLRERYALLAWSPNGTMAHMVPRERANGAHDLFQDEIPASRYRVLAEWDPSLKEAVSSWKRPVRFPHRWDFSLGSKFDIDMRFSISGKQPESVDIIRNLSQLSGFSVDLLNGNIGYILIGNNQETKASAYFSILPDVEHFMRLQNDDGHVLLTFDSKIIFDSEQFRMATSPVPLMMGDWYVPGRRLNGTLKSLRISDDFGP